MRSDVLNQNSQHTDWKKKVELIGVARTLTEVDSGKEFYLESSGGAFSITLPTGADIEDGVNYKFWVQENTPTGAITLAAGSAIVFGKINETEVDTSDDGPGSSADGATGVSNVILGTSALKGDFIELDAYGGHWFLNGQSGKDGAVTTS
jgi:hypothetical protein|tara:strand:- start:107 stop:556 length:450 start_codon:yes stop_codon:yes gene_type:complete